MKINKRLLIIIGMSGAVAAILSGLLYFLMLTEVSPVKQVSIPVLVTQLEKDGIVLEGNIKNVNFNADAVPYGVIKTKTLLVGKKVSQKIHAGEAMFESDIAERGSVAEGLKDLYVMGVDVNNISNYLGTQLEAEGIYYVLTETGNIKVTIAALVDTSGNAVFGDKQVPIKTVNLGVKTLEEIKILRQLELVDGIELIKYPEK